MAHCYLPSNADPAPQSGSPTSLKPVLLILLTAVSLGQLLLDLGNARLDLILVGLDGATAKKGRGLEPCATGKSTNPKCPTCEAHCNLRYWRSRHVTTTGSSSAGCSGSAGMYLVGNKGGGGVGNSQLARHTQLLQRGGLHLHAQVLGHKLSARHNGNVLQQRLTPLTKAGGLRDGRAGRR